MKEPEVSCDDLNSPAAENPPTPPEAEFVVVCSLGVKWKEHALAVVAHGRATAFVNATKRDVKFLQELVARHRLNCAKLPTMGYLVLWRMAKA